MHKFIMLLSLVILITIACITQCIIALNSEKLFTSCHKVRSGYSHVNQYDILEREEPTTITTIKSIYRIFEDFERNSIPNEIIVMIIHDYAGYKDPSALKHNINKLRQRIKNFEAGYFFCLPLWNILLFILSWSLLYACYCGVIFLYQNQQYHNRYNVEFACVTTWDCPSYYSYSYCLNSTEYNNGYDTYLIHHEKDWACILEPDTYNAVSDFTRQFTEDKLDHSNDILLSYLDEHSPDFDDYDDHYVELKINTQKRCCYSWCGCDGCGWTNDQMKGEIYLSDNGLSDSDFRLRQPDFFCCCCCPVFCCWMGDCCGCGCTVFWTGLSLCMFMEGVLFLIGLGLYFPVQLIGFYIMGIMDEIQMIDNEWNV